MTGEQGSPATASTPHTPALTSSLSTSLAGVSINAFKAPPFCSQDPSVWFSLVECNFKCNNITASLTKFSHATALLPPDVFSKVSDVIVKAISSKTPYEDLKTSIISRLQTPLTTRLQELLSKEELGNEKPSGLLRRMKQLLGDKFESFDKALFLQLFYQRLPQTVQQALFTVKNTLDIEKLADLADDFQESISREQVNVVRADLTANKMQSPYETHLIDLISQLTLRVDSLQKQVSSLESKVNGNNSQEANRDHSRRRFRSRSPSNFRDGMCFYHANFGIKARRCDLPCNFQRSNLNSQGGH